MRKINLIKIMCFVLIGAVLFSADMTVDNLTVNGSTLMSDTKFQQASVTVPVSATNKWIRIATISRYGGFNVRFTGEIMLLIQLNSLS